MGRKPPPPLRKPVEYILNVFTFTLCNVNINFPLYFVLLWTFYVVRLLHTVRNRKLWNRKMTLRLGLRLWDSVYDFENSREHKTPQLCTVNRSILLNKYDLLFCQLTIDYCYKVVFLFYSFLKIWRYVKLQARLKF